MTEVGSFSFDCVDWFCSAWEVYSAGCYPCEFTGGGGASSPPMAGSLRNVLHAATSSPGQPSYPISGPNVAVLSHSKTSNSGPKDVWRLTWATVFQRKLLYVSFNSRCGSPALDVFRTAGAKEISVPLWGVHRVLLVRSLVSSGCVFELEAMDNSCRWHRQAKS